jgi:hypothetical protein
MNKKTTADYLFARAMKLKKKGITNRERVKLPSAAWLPEIQLVQVSS